MDCFHWPHSSIMHRDIFIVSYLNTNHKLGDMVYMVTPKCLYMNLCQPSAQMYLLRIMDIVEWNYSDDIINPTEYYVIGCPSEW